ncbi:MAG: metalloregulator ArsR/SmtB family transcription factor [Proteobacteria bacterium]|nr:metalloregulator ArsR/SmtB family transcription factor [Pseudomonadota bacterium]
MDISATFSALGQTTRVQLLRALAGTPGMPAGDLRARVDVPASTLSFHLAALEQAGLVRATRRGRHIIYALRGAGLRDVATFVTETCGTGRPERRDDLARLFADHDDAAPAMTPAFNVLFLCTRNSARSIMAEAILERIGKGRFRAYSAGSDPAPEPLPEVIQRLQALGHDVSRLRCKSWHEFAGPNAPRMDFVIALCDTPRGRRCPEFGDTALTGAWPLPDPTKFTGRPVERAVLLNELYGALRRRLEIFCSLPIASLDRLAIKARLDEIGDNTPRSP